MTKTQTLDTNASGQIILFPLVGYSTTTLPDKSLLLRVEYLTGPLDTEGQSRQLAMTAAQARELGQALLSGASKAEKRTDRPDLSS